MTYHKGFTLLEMLVVMVIISLVAYLVIPKIDALLGGKDKRIQEQQYLSQISQIGWICLKQQKSLSWNKKQTQTKNALSMLLESGLPEHWKLLEPTQLSCSYTGVCKNITLSIITENADKITFKGIAPFCRLQQEKQA